MQKPQHPCNLRPSKSPQPRQSSSQKCEKTGKTSNPTVQTQPYTCYSKKGRLLAPNKHAVVAEGNTYIICEGSGENGQAVSGFVSEFLLKSTMYLFSLEEYAVLRESNILKLDDYFREMFQSANYELTLADIDARRSGCLATIVVVHGDAVIVASCGQPHIILIGKSEVRNLAHSKQISIIAGENTKKTCKQRNSGIRLRTSYRQESKQNEGGNGFGNTHIDGQICQPETSVFSTQQSEYLIVGSGSLFDNVQGAQMAKSLHEKPQRKLSLIAKQMSELASKRMKTISHEDVSCILVDLSK